MKEFLKKISIRGKEFFYYDISKLENIKKLPISYRIFIENLIRFGEYDSIDLILKRKNVNFNFRVSRIILQDFTGVPLIADIASLRDYLKKMGKDPKKANPKIPCHLVVDHSVIVDFFGTNYAYMENVKKEYERNRERYVLLKWAEENLKNFRVVPPGNGIVHQVNLEYLAEVVMKRGKILFPDTLIGADSHTPMINGLGVLGWGVGGIEAEAVLLGFPYNLVLPKVLGIKLKGKLEKGITATDLVLTITEILRSKNYSSWIVEFFGEGLLSLKVPDRTTISNMAPECGVLASLFPIDENTLEYLKDTGRSKSLIERVEVYSKKNLLFYEKEENIEYDDVIEIDLSKVNISISGPKSPHQRNSLSELKSISLNFIGKDVKKEDKLKDGSVVISAITSCTNTSNPDLMIMAGLLAKKAVQKGLNVKPWVKTSFAPGSKVVTDYLKKSGLLPYLEALKFHIVGYGCTTCIGNSGPLINWVEEEIKEKNLTTFAVLSGNRNFEGRINPYVKGSYLASPPIVVAFALSGNCLIDLTKEPLCLDPNGEEVFLKDLLPEKEEVDLIKKKFLKLKDFKRNYLRIFKGDENWESLEVLKSETFPWDENSTYLKKPPFFDEIAGLEPIKRARILAILDDNITTDHISPAGAIPSNSPAGKFLVSSGVEVKNLHSYGARRGNHQVMVRGTFGNIRIKNKMVQKEGPYTIKHPEGKEMFIYEAAMEYKKENVPLVVVAGKNYGMGSSRDWAAKGTYLLGIKAVITKSFERIHRQNLIAFGVLPLVLKEDFLFSGDEILTIDNENVELNKKLKILIEKEDKKFEIEGVPMFESEYELQIYREGGIFARILKSDL